MFEQRRRQNMECLKRVFGQRITHIWRSSEFVAYMQQAPNKIYAMIFECSTELGVDVNFEQCREETSAFASCLLKRKRTHRGKVVDFWTSLYSHRSSGPFSCGISVFGGCPASHMIRHAKLLKV